MLLTPLILVCRGQRVFSRRRETRFRREAERARDWSPCARRRDADGVKQEVTGEAQEPMRKPPTLAATAFHEAGHAVAAWHLGLRLDEVSIVSVEDRRGEQKGRVKCGWGDARSNAIYLLAGGITQDLFCPGYELGAED